MLGCEVVDALQFDCEAVFYQQICQIVADGAAFVLDVEGDLVTAVIPLSSSSLARARS